MIWLFTGKTGSGKTYTMTKTAYKHWLNGVDIYSNTVLFYPNWGGTPGVNILDNPECFSRFDRISEWCLQQIALRTKYEYFPMRRGRIHYFEEISELLEIREGIILIDEAQELFEARNWENLPYEFSNKLRQHRKHSLDLYATTQNVGTIDKNYRRLVQRWFHTTDIFAFLAKRNPSFWSIHKVEEKDIDELYGNPEDEAVSTIRTRYFFIHKWTRRLYDTLFDIGFKSFKIEWLEENNRRVCLIIPKNWSLNNGRTQLLLQKFYLDKAK